MSDLLQHASFPGQRSDEQVVVCVHRHWLFLLPDVLITAVLALVPVLLLVLVNLADGDPFSGNAQAVTAVALPAWYLAVTTFFFIRWLDFYLDLAVVTSERVIDVDQYGLFRRNIAELHHEAVQDVTTNKAGILPTVFNFGDVEIQTAGERANFTFRAVPKPEEIVKKITEVQQDHRDKEEKAAEELTQAAEKMGEAAEKMNEDVAEPLKQAVEQGDGQTSRPSSEPAPSEPSPSSEDSSSTDLPKEYER